MRKTFCVSALVLALCAPAFAGDMGTPPSASGNITNPPLAAEDISNQPSATQSSDDQIADGLAADAMLTVINSVLALF